MTYFTEDKPNNYFLSPHASCIPQKYNLKHFTNATSIDNWYLNVQIFFLGGEVIYEEKKIESWQLQYFHILSWQNTHKNVYKISL